MIPIADAHCDFLYYMHKDGWDIRRPKPPQAIAVPYMRTANARLQFFAAWIDADMKRNCLQQALDLIDAYWRMMESTPEFTPLTRSYDPSSDKIATVLTMEGGEGLNGEPANLRLFYRLGVRAMTLTWNHTNELASPAMRKANKGLTETGRRIVKEMNRLGMAVDVSHLSDAGIDELLSISTQPIFASHSNARAVFDHRRSLKDEHIKAIARQGGVIGVNYYPGHLTGSVASIADIVRHIVYIANLVGTEYVALGSDFDGMTEYPTDMRCWADVPKLISALSAAGFSQGEIERMAYHNLRNYIIRFCD